MNTGLCNPPRNALFFLVLVLGGCATKPEVPASCVISAYGPTLSTPKNRPLVESEIDEGILVGKTTEKIEIPVNTPNVSAKIGHSFGIIHRFDGLAKSQRVRVAMSHPQIDYDNGSVTEGRWLKSPSDGYTIFTFDLQEEMVEGEWKISFSHDNIELCSQSFFVEVP